MGTATFTAVEKHAAANVYELTALQQRTNIMLTWLTFINERGKRETLPVVVICAWKSV